MGGLIYPAVIAFGAVCMLLGFVLIARGIGGEESESTVKLIGIEIRTSRVGPGVVFALFGLVLTIVAVSRLPAAMPTPPITGVAASGTAASTQPSPQPASATPTSTPAAAPAVAPAPSSEATTQPVSVQPSFDCAKARSLDEVTICGDPQLAAEDRRYHDLYRAAVAQDPTGEARQEGIAALKQRGMCSSVACVRAWYEVRIAALGGG
jgi:uncharacterized protein YecT (DUF1311 family)